MKACELPYDKPAETVQGVISDLQALLGTLESHSATETSAEPSANFVDRWVVRRPFVKLSIHGQNKKCFVCANHGCWSSNHSVKERLQAYRQNKSTKQFIASF